MSRYVEFANLYDELMKDFDYELWADYIEEIFNRYQIKPKYILEMACGTGNLTYNLAKQRYNIVCFDLSSDMLSKAYDKLGRYKNVKILNQNMVNFNLNKKFDTVISICDSINYITKEDDLIECFKNVYNHLNKDGVFIFDINSYYKLRSIIGNNTFVEDRDDIYYIWQNYYDEETHICEFYLTFFKQNPDGSYHRFDEEHNERAYKVCDIIKMLQDVGFISIDIFEGFTFNEIKETTERINFVAVK